MRDSDCWKCGEPGHFAASCTLQLRATSYAEHMARIAATVDRWISREISIEKKRVLVSDENVQWYGPDVPRHLVYAPPP